MASVNLLIGRDAAESGQSGEVSSSFNVALFVGVWLNTCVATIIGSATADIGDASVSIGFASAVSGERERSPPLFSGAT